MAKLLVYYAHPGHKHSQANKAMVAEAQKVDGITFVDLYAEYPRFEIDIDREQQRLLDHDVILFQFPMFWYSTPSLIKEWQDLVLEHGFAYGAGGDKLAGLYDPDIPVHENTEYVEMSKAFLASHEGAMQGSSKIFGSRVERGWIPPTPDDEAAVIADNAAEGGSSEG